MPIRFITATKPEGTIYLFGLGARARSRRRVGREFLAQVLGASFWRRITLSVLRARGIRCEQYKIALLNFLVVIISPHSGWIPQTRWNARSS